MYLLEATGEQAFELMADLFDPVAEIASDMDVLACIQSGQKLKAIRFALKNHAKAMTKIMALCEGVAVEDYKKTAPEMLRDVLLVVNHPIVADLFTSQAQSNDEASSGSATENTEA